MAATTWTADDVGGNTAGATTRVKLALEKADNSFIAGQAGAGGGLAVEGVVGGTPVPVSGTVTAAVDTSALATEAKQTELNTYVAPGTWVPASCIPPGDSAVLSASPCVVRSVIASNCTGDTVYMMLFDAASVPADSTAPRLPFIVIPAESTVQVELGGMTCANGLCWSTTTTFDVKTIGSTTPIVVSAELI